MKDTFATRRSTILRGAGLVLIVICLFSLDADAGSPLHRLWLPLLLGLGAALALQNLLAVALALTALAGIHADPAATDWVSARAYPLLAGIGAATIVGILVGRFRRFMAGTREDRQAARRARRAHRDRSAS